MKLTLILLSYLSGFLILSAQVGIVKADEQSKGFAFKHLKLNTMKNFTLLLFIFSSILVSAQVGINTETPGATLDVVGKATTTTDADGIIAPRLTGDQLKAKDAAYTTAQHASIIYATEAVGTSTSKTVNVTAPGYYYYNQPTASDAGVWEPFDKSETMWDLFGNAGTSPNDNFVGTTDDQPLVFRTNNMERLRITTTGRLDLSNTGNNIFVEGGNEATTGSFNTAVGGGALSSNTTGSFNTSLGISTLQNSTTASFNVAIGVRAALFNKTGTDNVAIGVDAMRGGPAADPTKNYNGTYNVAVGRQAGHYLSDGHRNVFLGYNAGRYTTTGSDNVFIGYATGPRDVSDGTLSNVVAIGRSISPTTSNTIILGQEKGGAYVSNVGIGTYSPTEKLVVEGAIKVDTAYSSSTITNNATSPVPNGGAGTIVFQNNHFFGWNGTEWKQLDN